MVICYKSLPLLTQNKPTCKYLYFKMFPLIGRDCLGPIPSGCQRVPQRGEQRHSNQMAP